MAKCRVDHYQTLNEVHVSVFAKAANQQQSKIEFEESKVSIGPFYQIRPR
jgi:hypothetical protein